MVINQQKFNLNDKLVLEKLIIEPPFRFDATFQDRACFLHIREGHAVVNSPIKKYPLNSNDTLLLSCDKYFTDYPKQSPNTTCEVYAIHLYPEILKEIYKDEIQKKQKITVGV